MASFKTHIAFGTVIGIIGAVLLSTYALVTANMLLLLFVFFAIIGSTLPDLDSDSGIPFQLVFAIFSLTCALIGGLYVFRYHVQGVALIVGIPLMCFVVARWVIAPLAKRFTHHRGIFHSIPALVIAMCVSIIILHWFRLSPSEELAIAIGVGLGFLSHLILDELVSVTNFSGMPFFPKKSLGSALKLFSKSRNVTVATYALLLVLLSISIPLVREVVYNWTQ